MLEDRQIEMLEIFAKLVSKENDTKETIDEFSNLFYKYIFDLNSNYDLVYPLLRTIIGKYLGKSASLREL